MKYGYIGDPRYEPLSPWQYFWLSVLYSIPVIGFIFLIVFSFSSSNINRRNYTRSYFCLLALIIIVFVIFALAGGGSAILASLFD